jgi:hypothetical protein
MTKIKITAHVTSFLVVEDRGDGMPTILAEHRRYSNALAAARLLGRDMELPVEEQPARLEGGGQ